MSKIDLHMHSVYSSDGDFTPEMLMRKCRERGLWAAALTDHNSVKGTAAAAREAKRQGLLFIPGVEMDCVCKGTVLHLLGYGIETESDRLVSIEKNILDQERKASALRIRLLHEMGIEFEDDRVWALAWNGVVTPEMIGEIAIGDERNKDNPLIRPFLPGGTRSDNPYVNFYWDLCSPGKEAFAPVDFLSFDEMNSLLLSLGGITVIAHPELTVGRDEELIAYMVRAGVSGIEVFSSYHGPKQVEYYSRLAEKHGLIQTAGSDFHGKTKPAVKLGRVPGQVSDKGLLKDVLSAICKSRGSHGYQNIPDMQEALVRL